MKSKIILASALLLILGLAGVAYKALAQENPGQSDPSYNFHGQMGQMHEQMEKAFENGDYKSWNDLVNKYGMGSMMRGIVSEENFPRFAEMHRLMWNGNYGEAREIGKGFGTPMMGEGSRGNMMGDDENDGYGMMNGGGMMGGNGYGMMGR